MTVTVDINVLLDVFEQRQPHFAESARVLSMVAAGSLTGVAPAHGLTTIYYLVRKHSSKPDAEAAVDRVMGHFRIGNLDATVVAQAPKLAPHIPAMCACIAQALGVPVGQVNVKAKTAEKLGPVGEGRSMEAHAVALIYRAG